MYQNASNEMTVCLNFSLATYLMENIEAVVYTKTSVGRGSSGEGEHDKFLFPGDSNLCTS
jgi:hypothetical protein